MQCLARLGKAISLARGLHAIGRALQARDEAESRMVGAVVGTTHAAARRPGTLATVSVLTPIRRNPPASPAAFRVPSAFRPPPSAFASSLILHPSSLASLPLPSCPPSQKYRVPRDAVHLKSARRRFTHLDGHAGPAHAGELQAAGIGYRALRRPGRQSRDLGISGLGDFAPSILHPSACILGFVLSRPPPPAQARPWIPGSFPRGRRRCPAGQGSRAVTAGRW